MKEFNFESISIPKIWISTFVSFILILSTAFVMSKLIHGMYSLIIMLLLIGICYLISKKFIMTKMNVIIKEKEFIINNEKFSFTDLVSFNFDKTNYIEKSELRFKDKIININVSSRSKSHFKEFKSDVLHIAHQINKNRSDNNRIIQKNFYNSRYALPYLYITIGVMLIWIMSMILKPERFTLSNFSLFLVVLAGLIPIFIKVKEGNKRK